MNKARDGMAALALSSSGWVDEGMPTAVHPSNVILC